MGVCVFWGVGCRGPASERAGRQGQDAGRQAGEQGEVLLRIYCIEAGGTRLTDSPARFYIHCKGLLTSK